MNTQIPARNRILSLALALCLALGMTLYLPGPVEVSAAETVHHDIENDGPITITANGEYRIYGSGTLTTNTITVQANVTASITLEDVNIENSAPNACAFDMTGARVYLTLAGENHLASGGWRAGLEVPDGAELVITADSDGGKLTASSTGISYGPGIGGGYGGSTGGAGGDVTIYGGTVVATSDGGAGIGGGQDSSTGLPGGHVTIHGGTVVATSRVGAGIGGGQGATGGAGGDVTIHGGTVVATSTRGAGIGGGYGGTTGGAGGHVTIHGGTVTATSTDGAGIGSGYSTGTPGDGGSLHVSGGATLNLNNRGTNVAPSDLEIGECTINDNTGIYDGTYHWLLVEGGSIDMTTVEPFWLTDGAGRQIIRAGDTVRVDAAPGFARWYTSGNIPLANPGFDPALDPAVFNMPVGNAWIAYTNLAKPLSVNPDTLSLDLDNNRTGTVTPDMGVDDSDGLSPLATQVTATSSNPAVADVDYGPHTGDVTITAKSPGTATVFFTFNDSGPTAVPVTVNVAASTTPGPSVFPAYVKMAEGETKTFFVSLGEGYNGAESATIASNNTGVATAAPLSLGQSGDVTVTGVTKGTTTISIGYSGGSRHGKTDTVQVTVTGSGSRSSSSGGSSTPDGQTAKIQLPASAFRWDGDRTLTIDHERITPLGLLSVQWDGKALTRGTQYSVHQGSVIVRFAEDFMAGQSTGEHTIRVEFLNHYGETTVTVGGADLAGLDDNDTYNPNTGGYLDGSYPGTDNTGSGRGVWAALLLGSLGAAALVFARKDIMPFRRNQQ